MTMYRTSDDEKLNVHTNTLYYGYNSIPFFHRLGKLNQSGAGGITNKENIPLCRTQSAHLLGHPASLSFRLPWPVGKSLVHVKFRR